MDTTEPRRYAPIIEAASYIGVHPKTIRRLVQAGHLTRYGMGSRIVRVDLDELDALLSPAPDAKTVA